MSAIPYIDLLLLMPCQNSFTYLSCCVSLCVNTYIHVPVCIYINSCIYFPKSSESSVKTSQHFSTKYFSVYNARTRTYLFSTQTQYHCYTQKNQHELSNIIQHVVHTQNFNIVFKMFFILKIRILLRYIHFICCQIAPFYNFTFVISQYSVG